ncbi:hypothetical protein OG985_12970 [Streptomyces sp. NBC_00289]|uniref:hypothetical protein n=1 Tax=Streptomyces sp. NBC_00289 TaxID=2975703 RepID=UPI0032544562
MRTPRRGALLCAVALCGLVSCGIPATGVVEAGGPAEGIVPTVRVYFVRDGSLVAVARRIDAPVEVRAAVEQLLLGPTRAESTKRLVTLLPPPISAATTAPSPAPGTTSPAESATADPDEGRDSAAVKVTTKGDAVSVELPAVVKELNRLAVAQLVCTAVEAQRTAEAATGPATAAATVTVTVTNALGRSVEGSGEDCPDS